MTMTRLAVLLLVLLSSACGAAQEREGCGQFRCEPEVTAFDPAPELLLATEVELARLARATGRDDLRVSPGGVPVVLVEDIVAEHPASWNVNAEACGQTVTVTWNHRLPLRSYTQEIQIDPTEPANCHGMRATLMHEMIHALAPDAAHRPDSEVFADATRSNRLDAPALEALCSQFECALFNPEE
jgi:hypothetical protein